MIETVNEILQWILLAFLFYKTTINKMDLIDQRFDHDGVANIVRDLAKKDSDYAE